MGKKRAHNQKKPQRHNHQSYKKYIRTDDVIRVLNGEPYDEDSPLYVCEAPRLFIRLGLKKKPVFIKRDKFNNAMAPENTDSEIHTHNVSEHTMRNLHQLLTNPLCAYASFKYDKLSIVLVLEDTSEDNRPIVAVIQPNKNVSYATDDGSHYMPSNLLITIYPLNNAPKKLQTKFNQGLIMYVNPEVKNKGVFLRRIQLQLLHSEYSRPIKTVCQIEEPRASAHANKHEVKKPDRQEQAPTQDTVSLTDTLNEKKEMVQMLNAHPFEEVHIRGEPRHTTDEHDAHDE